MLIERNWENFDITKIANIQVFGCTTLDRYFLSKHAYLTNLYDLPSLSELQEIGNGSFDKIWIQAHNCYYLTTFEDGTRFKQSFFRGFAYDKASTPIGKNNIQEGTFPIKGHDQGCSTHCFDFLAVNNDKGFRANNLFFYYSLLWWIDKEFKEELKLSRKNAKENKTNRFKQFFIEFKIKRDNRKKKRRAKVWFLAVNSIAGQGFYEKNTREWHKKTTMFEVLR